MVGFLHPSGQPLDLKLIILDKDGTLVDFCRTWLPGFKECAAKTAEAAGEPNLEPALLKAGGWVDEDPPRVTQEGLFLHAPLPEIAQAWIDTQPLVAQRFESASELTALMEEVLEPASVRDVTPLGPVEETLQALKSGGLKLAVVTNDQEQLARKQLERLGWIDYFDAGIIGADSGHGPKPEPGGVRAAIEAAGVEPSQAIMIGDAEGDMTSGRRAGCAFTVAIWPEGKPLPAGLASAACRMADLGHLPDALAAAGWKARSDVDALATAAEGLALEEEDGREKAAVIAAAAAAAATAAAAAVDSEVVGVVEGMAS